MFAGIGENGRRLLLYQTGLKGGNDHEKISADIDRSGLGPFGDTGGKRAEHRRILSGSQSVQVGTRKLFPRLFGQNYRMVRAKKRLA